MNGPWIQCLIFKRTNNSLSLSTYFVAIAALTIMFSRKQSEIHMTMVFPVKRTKSARATFNGPMNTLQDQAGTTITLCSITGYPTWLISWLFRDLFKESSPYLSNFEGFQLLDLIIMELISHMTCYNSMHLIGWNYSIQTGEQIL